MGKILVQLCDEGEWSLEIEYVCSMDKLLMLSFKRGVWSISAAFFPYYIFCMKNVFKQKHQLLTIKWSNELLCRLHVYLNLNDDASASIPAHERHRVPLVGKKQQCTQWLLLGWFLQPPAVLPRLQPPSNIDVLHRCSESSASTSGVKLQISSREN